MRISGIKLNESLRKQLIATLAQTLVDIKNPGEAEVFLADFFNQSELETYAKRLAIAYWLKKGRSYSNIKNNLKVSSATIAVVQETMTKPGIALTLKKIEADEWANQWTEKIKKFVKK